MATAVACLSSVALVTPFPLHAACAQPPAVRSRRDHASLRAARARPRAGVATMGLKAWLAKVLLDEETTEAAVPAAAVTKMRLNMVLAADRSGLDEKTMKDMRAEIQVRVALRVYEPAQLLTPCVLRGLCHRK
jgi:hypothetical protein